MKTESKERKRLLWWEVSAEAHAAEVVEYFGDVEKALNFCAIIFFANTLFDANTITIRYSGISSPLTLGFYYPARLKKGSWLVKTLINGKVHCRWFDDLETVFHWLRTELENPTAGIIQIWRQGFACADDDPVPGVEPSEIPFACEA